MRTQEACRLIDKEMRKFYKASITNLPDLSILRCFKQKRIYSALKQLEELCVRNENNIRIGRAYEVKPITDMYPDIVSVEETLFAFHYISDRWRCAGRIKFILRVLESI